MPLGGIGLDYRFNSFTLHPAKNLQELHARLLYIYINRGYRGSAQHGPSTCFYSMKRCHCPRLWIYFLSSHTNSSIFASGFLMIWSKYPPASRSIYGRVAAFKGPRDNENGILVRRSI